MDGMEGQQAPKYEQTPSNKAGVPSTTIVRAMPGVDALM